MKFSTTTVAFIRMSLTNDQSLHNVISRELRLQTRDLIHARLYGHVTWRCQLIDCSRITVSYASSHLPGAKSSVSVYTTVRMSFVKLRVITTCVCSPFPLVHTGKSDKSSRNNKVTSAVKLPIMPRETMPGSPRGRYFIFSARKSELSDAAAILPCYSRKGIRSVVTK
ncbi:hypothetical protein Bbelb_158290 [Branchiostoma belcheri]|nr:hypothetical protein Bbelb_158290 [Branchiostoma belcheri]